MSLFAAAEEANRQSARPLAARLRPRSLDEFVGQAHLVGPGQPLRKLIEADRLGSAIFHGPPGTGKTTLARIIANQTSRHYRQLSAILHGVKDLREVLAEARQHLETGGQGTVLFIDEIHRFNKSQQDALLADVEDGVVALVGATTSNPFFAVNQALVSRSQLFAFEPISEADIQLLLRRALSDTERGLGATGVTITPEASQWLATACEGDGRQALATLERAVILASDDSGASPQLDIPLMQQALGQRAQRYDATGDEHYDCASALIKSLRGSDPDAGLYWLARMLEGGEDVRFLCRRLIILASEDVGNADPHALPLAVACSQACEQIGLPECQLTLAQTVTYLACAPKSNASTRAIGEALSDVRQQRILPVPRALRDSHYAGAEQLQHGAGYQSAHGQPDGVAAMDYLGVDREYYHPVDRGHEAELAQRLEAIRAKLKQAKSSSS